ncbi:MAG: hypothetical protein JWQ42_3131 [Edaphobacter sp.]|nr:hypothetical protein [Edaphobacter sp.]
MGEIDGEGLEDRFGVSVGIDGEHDPLDGGSRDLDEEIAVAFEGLDEGVISGLLSGGGGDGLGADTPGSCDDVGDLECLAVAGDLASVALVAVGVAGEEEVRLDAGLLADGVDLGEHGSAGRVAAGGEGRVMGGKDERLAGASLTLGGDGLESLEEPCLLGLARDGARDEARILGGIGVEGNDLHERGVEEVVDAGLVHGLAEDGSGDGWDDLRWSAEVGQEGAEADGVGGGKDFTVVVAGDGDDLAGVVDVGLVEFGAVVLVFVGAVDDVAEVEEEGGRDFGRGDVEVGLHGIGDGSLGGVGAVAGVSGGVEADGAGGLNLLCPLRTDDLIEGEGCDAGGHRDGLEVSLDVVQQLSSDAGNSGALGDRGGGEEGMSEAEGLAGLCGSGFFRGVFWGCRLLHLEFLW